jgi:glycosyltransferase involved in cell wall biosynthesis
MPRVTIVVPVYNEEAFLEETLKSLRAQTFKDYELIVVDNGSTDRSPEIARKWADVVLEEHVRGWAAAVHRGFSVAKGEFLASADADTFYPRNWLNRLVRALNRSGCVAVYGPLAFRESSRIARGAQAFGYTLLCGLSRMFGVRLAAGANLGMRREAYFAVGGYPAVAGLASPDLRLVKRLTRLGKVQFVPNMVCYTSNRRFKQLGYVRGSLEMIHFWLDVAMQRNRLTLEEYHRRTPRKTRPE